MDRNLLALKNFCQGRILATQLVNAGAKLLPGIFVSRATGSDLLALEELSLFVTNGMIEIDLVQKKQADEGADRNQNPK